MINGNGKGIYEMECDAFELMNPGEIRDHEIREEADSALDHQAERWAAELGDVALMEAASLDSDFDAAAEVF